MSKKNNNKPDFQENTDVQDTQEEPSKTEATIEDLSFSLYERRSYEALVAIFQELRELRGVLSKEK